MSSSSVPFCIKNAEITELKELIHFARMQAYKAYIEDTEEKDLNDYLDEEYAEIKFINYLNDKENIFLVVKNEEEKLIAYSLVTKCILNIDGVNKEFDYELKKLYVDEAFQGQGLGTKLIQEIKHRISARCREDYRRSGCDENYIEPKIYLSVFIQNEKAQRFYEKQKFKFFAINSIPFGDDFDFDKVYVNDFSLEYKED